MAPHRKRSAGRALAAATVAAACWAALRGSTKTDDDDAFVTTPVNSRVLRGNRLQLRAEGLGMCSGRCIGNNWTDVKSIPIESEEEDQQAAEGWEIFKQAYPAASEKGIFIDTPVEENDIKYRWRRLKQLIKVDGAEMNKIISMDAVPLVVDSDYVQGTFEAMIRGSDYDKALSVVQRNPAVLTAGKDIEQNMGQADMVSNFVSTVNGLKGMFR
eukprot:TRINITY_DN1259_c0_g2_i2.p1 TRINITY_DN1259_c0_g2~~TRINITY_DN1259_c0_g2_i2.p1  ORF type:complete len:214 (-),score=54.67 TRINITY_DN1259_c0_g2_i2:309-950(-)